MTGIVLRLTPAEADAVREALRGRASQHRPYADLYHLNVDEPKADLLEAIADRLA